MFFMLILPSFFPSGRIVAACRGLHPRHPFGVAGAGLQVRDLHSLQPGALVDLIVLVHHVFGELKFNIAHLSSV